METCAYCGSKVEKKYCAYCDMQLADSYILSDGKRKSHAIDHLPPEGDIFKSTKELLQLDTISLLCLLRYARKHRSDIYNWRHLTHKAGNEGGDVNEMQEMSFGEYEDATRKVWVIENIIKDRMGYYPKKVTDDFISRYHERIQASEKKRMILRKSIVKK